MANMLIIGRKHGSDQVPIFLSMRKFLSKRLLVVNRKGRASRPALGGGNQHHPPPHRNHNPSSPKPVLSVL